MVKTRNWKTQFALTLSLFAAFASAELLWALDPLPTGPAIFEESAPDQSLQTHLNPQVHKVRPAPKVAPIAKKKIVKKKSRPLSQRGYKKITPVTLAPLKTASVKSTAAKAPMKTAPVQAKVENKAPFSSNDLSYGPAQISSIPVAMAPKTSPRSSQDFIATSFADFDDVKGVEEKAKWEFALSYSATTDLNEQTKPREYSHLLGADMATNVSRHDQLFASISAAYAAYENGEVLLDRETKQSFLQDFEIGYAHDFQWGLTKWDASLSNAFPTSPYTRQDGVDSVTSASLKLGLPVIEERLSFGTSVDTHYIWNQYEKSPTTTRVNKQAGLDFNGAFKVNFGAGIYGKVGGGVRYSRFTDGSGIESFRNVAGLGLGLGNFSAELSYSNGSYADQDQIDLFLVDEYRRIVKFSMGYSF